MIKPKIAIVRYENPLESVRKAVKLSQGLDHLPSKAKVFIKPNIAFWTKAVPFPKWGVITTSRVVEDMVALLKERGIDEITIGEGMVTMEPRDTETPAHSFKMLGYANLKKRYGTKIINVFERPFKKIDLGNGVRLSFNIDILSSDFIVDLPVMKSHSQTIVSLGIKNLKGTIDMPSRKRCHSADPEKDLHFIVAKLADKMPPIFTLIDGIYTLERGPGPDGRMRRSDILVASADILSVDMVGAKILGYEPSQIPHLVHAANNLSRPMDLSDVELVGERIEEVASFHEYDFQYAKDKSGELPLSMAKRGIQGISYRKYDTTLCTYCSGINGVVLTAIQLAWKEQQQPWDGVEILNGKRMKPTPGKKKTILLGECIYKANKDNPDIQEMIPVKGCPPKPKDIVKALHQAGIEVDSTLFENIDQLPGFLMHRYDEKDEFDESFFQIS